MMRIQFAYLVRFRRLSAIDFDWMDGSPVCVECGDPAIYVDNKWRELICEKHKQVER